MKKKLIILLLGGILLGGNILKVNAEEVNGTTEWKQITIGEKNIYKNYNTIEKNKEGKDYKYYQFGVNLITFDEKIVYCIENGKTVVQGNDKISDHKSTDPVYKDLLSTYIPKDSKVTFENIEFKTSELISLIGYYGTLLYENSESTHKQKYYLAAQKLIWEVMSDAKIYPTEESERINGKIFYTTKNLDENIKYSENDIQNIIYKLDNEEEAIKQMVINYVKLPEIINLKNIKDFKINDDNDVITYTKEFNDIEFDKYLNEYKLTEDSECKIDYDKTTITCNDSNNDNKLNLNLIKGDSEDFYYYVIDDGNKEDNQKFISSYNANNLTGLPKKEIKHKISISTPESSVETPEPDEDNPETADTNIILIITICCCALISAIIIYIKKINLIKNNTI